MRAPVHHTRAGMEASKGVKEGKISAPGAGTIKAVPLRDQRHRLQPQKRRKTMAADDTRSGPSWQGVREGRERIAWRRMATVIEDRGPELVRVAHYSQARAPRDHKEPRAEGRGP